LTLDAEFVVNSTGLDAPGLARRLAEYPSGEMPNAYYAKGQYYTLTGRSPFRRLVYPVAEAGGLGVHVTLDLAGQARFGPDVIWIDGVDYRFDERNRERFVAAIRRYYPDLDERRLHPGYTGIRPKISAAGEPAADFLVLGPRDHGIDGLLHLFGIESPGLTASLALAEVVSRAAEARV
jgi:L-2-hydroxyglutarate oxidase LhgO